MASIFLAAAFLYGFALKMVVSATVFALLSYVIARICWNDPETKLPRGIGWGVWFAILAHHLFPLAFIKAFSLSGAYLHGAIVASGAVLALAGLYVLMVRSDGRFLRAVAFVSTFLVIGVISQIPFGDYRPGRSVAAAPGDEASMRATASLYAAALRGDIERIRALVGQGVDVNGTFMMLTPLYGAVIERQLEAARVLIDLGADVNSANGPARRSPLHQAVRNGDVAMIELLLQRGADVNATTTHGRTPLEYAVNPPLPLTKPENSEEIAAILKKAGAK